MNKKNDKLSTSWYYSYETFDLVRIYKTFNFKNNKLVFMGY